MKPFGYALIVQGITYVILIFLSVRDVKDIYFIPLIILVSQSACALFQYYHLKKELPEYKFKFNISKLKYNIQKSFPVLISHIMLIIAQSIPVIFIGFFLSDTAVGFFTSSQRISFLIWEVICQYLTITFPAMSKYYLKEMEKLNKVVNYSIKFLFVVLMPLVTYIAILSYSITEFIYGSRFIPSYLTLKILIFLPILMFLESFFTNLLIAAHRQKIASKIKTISTFLMLIILWFITGKTNINIVAITILFFSGFNFDAQYFYSRDIIKVDFLNSMLKPIFYSALSGFIIFYLKSYSLILAFIIAFVFYAFMIYRFKTFDREEIEFIKDNLKLVKSKILSLSPSMDV